MSNSTKSVTDIIVYVWERGVGEGTCGYSQLRPVDDGVQRPEMNMCSTSIMLLEFNFNKSINIV